MKKLFISILAFCMLSGLAFAETYYVEIAPVTATYEQRVEDGVTVYQRADVSHKGERMSFSGTSVCQVLDLHKLKTIDGRFTYQFRMLAGTSDVPVSGTSVSVHWKGSDIDTASAWVQATKNTIVNGINAFSGITDVGYDVNDITGVTPFRYMRIEFESGISKELGGAGNIRPIGVLQIR